MLFTDVVGSTALVERHGPEAADRLRREHFLALRAAVAAHGGREVKKLGDGLMVVFTSAVPAVACAVEMQRRAGLTVPGSLEPLGLRIGIAVGEADVEADDFFGRPVVEASLLCGAASGGQILVSDLVRLLVGARGGHELVAQGELALKGFDSPLAAFEVLWSPEPVVAEDGLAMPLPGLLALEAPVPFVGRSGEWGVLEAAWAGAKAGERRAVLVGGDAGAGKTRLVSEFARFAQRCGTVLFGASTETFEVPFQPFIQALTYMLENAPDDVRHALIDGRVAELATLLPDLSDAPRPVGRPEREGDAERYQLFEAVTALLADLARYAPVLLVLDDLHWARRPTVQLLDHLLRSTRLGHVCILATFRTTPADMGEPLNEALSDLRRRAGVERLTLTGFDPAGVRAFVVALASHDVDAALEPLVTHLTAITAGNAFLLGELWRHLIEVGCLVRLAGRWSLAAPLGTAGSPEGVREVVGRRLMPLPTATRKLVELAAVTGVEFELGVLAAAGEIDEVTALDAIEPAVEARLVDEAGAARFRFPHALVREAVADRLSPGTRRRHHLAVGRALEGLGRGSPDELAYHLAAAVPLVPAHEAIGYARRGAASAMQSLAYDHAVTTLRSVLDLAVGADRIDVLLDLAGAEAWAANTVDSRRFCLDAAELARRFGDRDRLVRAALIMSEATWRGMAYGANAAHLLREVLAGDNDDATRARLLGGLSAALALSGQTAEAVAVGDEAIGLARKVGDRRLLLVVMHTSVVVDWRPDTKDRQFSIIEEGLSLARAAGDEEAELRLAAKLILGLWVLGDTRRLRAELARHEELARRFRQPFYLLTSIGQACTVALNEGRFADAEGAAEEFRRLSESVPDGPDAYGVQMFGIRREQGRLGEMRPVLELVTRSHRQASAWRPGLAVAYAEVGLLDEARALIHQLVADDVAAIERDSLWSGVLSFLADACTLTSHRRGAGIVYRHLLEFKGLMAGMTGLSYYGSVDRYLGKLAQICQRPGEALAHFESALRQDEAAGWPVWTAHSRYALGRFLAERGRTVDRERSTSLLQMALAASQTLGMAVLAERCQEVIESTAAHEGRRVALTSRELAVLRLVAEGRTNQEIGGALHTSRHTVANQVRAILVKTACSNRTELAGWAHRHGLAVH